MRAVIITLGTQFSECGRSIISSKKGGAIHINTKNGAEAPIFLTDICSMSCVNEIVQHKLFNAVADGIHTARPFKVIGGFEFVAPSI